MSLMIAALLLAAQPADQQLPAPATSDAPAPKKVKEKTICKADPATSGSRMAKRMCLTESEWAERSTSMKDSARSGFSGKAEDN